MQLNEIIWDPKKSKSQGVLGKSQFQCQYNADNKSSEIKVMTLPQSECTDNVIFIKEKKADNIFNCIICEKSFLSKHNLKIHDNIIQKKTRIR